MTTRRLALLTVGIVTLVAFSAPALADGWGFGFSFSHGGGYGYGWGGACYRPYYFPRSYVYQTYSPVVVYNDCAPNVVVCDPPPVTVFRSYCAPAVVYPTYAPRYYGGAYVARGYHPAYWGGFRAGFYYNSGRNYRAVYHGGHGRAYWR